MAAADLGISPMFRVYLITNARQMQGYLLRFPKKSGKSGRFGK
jgi:hypothetical protein